VVCGEIGGSNSMTPLRVAIDLGLAVVDADPMGRAFPELQMDTFNIGGVSTTRPRSRTKRANVVILSGTRERLDGATGQSGDDTDGRSAGLPCRAAWPPAQVAGIWGANTATASDRRCGVPARERRVETTLAPLGARLLFRGKIVDLERVTTGGFARGTVTMQGIAGDSGDAACGDPEREPGGLARRPGRGHGARPDLHTGRRHGEPIGRKSALRSTGDGRGLAADAKLSTPAGLTVVGRGRSATTWTTGRFFLMLFQLA